MNDVGEFKRIVRSFEEVFKCSITLHDYTGEIRKCVDFMPNIHTNPYCSVLKEKKREVNPLCRNFVRYISEQKLQERMEPFFKYCHAEVFELVMPLSINRKLTGVLYIGPFRINKDMLPPDTFISAKKCGGLEKYQKQKDSLPEITRPEAYRLLDMSSLLACKLSEIVRESLDDELSVKSRKERIESFLCNNFKKNISLSDLAAFLLLSESRTTQLLRENFGRGFPELVREKRIEYASFLLENSSFSVTSIASLAGFSDPAYFFRIFRKEKGITPQNYRNKSGDPEL